MKANEIRSSEEITKMISVNTAKIEKLTAEISEFNFDDEKRNAIQEKNISEYKRLSALADENTDAIVKKSETILKLKIANSILKDNRKIAIVKEALPLIDNACKPYNGKSYGEKTRQKICDEVRKAGYAFYFSGSCIGIDQHYLHIAKLDKRGCAYGSDFIDLYLKEYDNAIVTEENKLNFQPENISTYENRYVFDISRRVNEIIRAYKAHEKEIEKATATRSALYSILPESAKKIPDISKMNTLSYLF